MIWHTSVFGCKSFTIRHALMLIYANFVSKFSSNWIVLWGNKSMLFSTQRKILPRYFTAHTVHTNHIHELTNIRLWIYACRQMQQLHLCNQHCGNKSCMRIFALMVFGCFEASPEHHHPCIFVLWKMHIQMHYLLAQLHLPGTCLIFPTEALQTSYRI